MTQIQNSFHVRSFGLSLPMLVLAFGLCASSNAELAWGKPASIVVAINAPEEEQIAAREFQRLYKLRTGEELPITNEEGGEHAVYVGRAALNIERKRVEHISPDGSRRVRGTPQKREICLERSLDFDFDTLSKDDFVYSLTGWTGTFEMFIAGATPHATLDAVYDFCEKNLDTKRDANKDVLAHLAPFRGWSLNTFVEKPDVESQRLKKELKLRLPETAVQTSNDSQNPKVNGQK